MSDTCSLFLLFEDPWPSCLLTFHYRPELWLKVVSLNSGRLTPVRVVAKVQAMKDWKQGQFAFSNHHM